MAAPAVMEFLEARVAKLEAIPEADRPWDAAAFIQSYRYDQWEEAVGSASPISATASWEAPQPAFAHKQNSSNPACLQPAGRGVRHVSAARGAGAAAAHLCSCA